MSKTLISLTLAALAACSAPQSSHDAGVPDAGTGGAQVGGADAGTGGTQVGGADGGEMEAGTSDAGGGGSGGAAALSISPPSATVPAGGQQLFTAQGGVGPWAWSLPTNASGGSVSAFDSHVSLAPAPTLSGAAQWQHWAHSQPVVVRDNHGNHELFTFGSPSSFSGQLHLLRSADQGTTWSWPMPDSYAQGVDSYDNAGVMSVAQDSAGRVHLLYARVGYGDVAYYRLNLTYAGGAITGYAGLVGPVAIPGTYAGDLRGELRTVTTASGAEVLAVLVAASDSSGARMQGSMCITSSLTPAASSDFKSLQGTPNAVTTVLDDARGGIHDHNILFAQLGASRDLWVFSGNIPAEAAPTAPNTLNRVRLTASGATWSAGPLLDGATSDVWMMGVEGTAHHVWAMFGRYTDGQVLFARVNEAGSFEEPVSSIPSPVNDGRVQQTMFGVFTVNPDETRIWTIFARDPSPSGNWYDFTPTAGAWDGTSWQLQVGTPAGDTYAISYAEGLAGTVGWDTGVVGLMTKSAGTSFNGPIHLMTSRAPGALYTAGPTGSTTDIVQVRDAHGATATAVVTVP